MYKYSVLPAWGQAEVRSRKRVTPKKKGEIEVREHPSLLPHRRGRCGPGRKGRRLRFRNEETVHGQRLVAGEHRVKRSKITDAPCSLEPPVDMNFLWAALKEGGHNCQVRALPEAPGWGRSFSPGRSVHSEAAECRGQSNSETGSNPAVFLCQYCCSPKWKDGV